MAHMLHAHVKTEKSGRFGFGSTASKNDVAVIVFGSIKVESIFPEGARMENAKL